jgi:Cu2+-containing amine oxidase
MRPANLPSYIIPAQSVNSADVVVWYWGSIHHLTRDEDGTETTFDFSGVAQVMWGGFMLKPHNLFDGPPLWP